MNNDTDYEEEARRKLRKAYEKIKWTLRHDHLLHGALLLFVVILGFSFVMQYMIGSTGLDEGVVIHEEKNQTLTHNNFKIFTAKFNLPYNAFSFGSTDKINVYVLEGNYSGTTALTNITANYYVEKLKTNSWSYFFNKDSTYSIVLSNTNGNDILYSITIRDYTPAEAQKISYRTIGVYAMYASILPLAIYVLIKVFKRYSIIPIFLLLVGFFSYIMGRNRDDGEYRNKK